ncbi:hypothetical protein PTKIN_Ptkin10aG0009800 [Pterospermum kingtungense]
MHLYNTWLPPPVAEETKKESFSRVVSFLKNVYRPDDPTPFTPLSNGSLLSTLIILSEDVVSVIEIDLELFHKSKGKLYAQEYRSRRMEIETRHFETVTSLVRSSRQFFPAGSASEIWSEFRQGAGFVKLILPTNPKNQDFFSE